MRRRQEEQIDYARALRVLKVGLDPRAPAGLLQSWMNKAEEFKGRERASPSFLVKIKQDAIATA